MDDLYIFGKASLKITGPFLTGLSLTLELRVFNFKSTLYVLENIAVFFKCFLCDSCLSSSFYLEKISKTEKG